MAMAVSTCLGGLTITSRLACVEGSSAVSTSLVSDMDTSLYSCQSGLLHDRQSRHGVRCINAVPTRLQSHRHRRASGSGSVHLGQRSSIFLGSRGTDQRAAIDLCRVGQLASSRQVAVNAADGDQALPAINVEVDEAESIGEIRHYEWVEKGLFGTCSYLNASGSVIC